VADHDLADCQAEGLSPDWHLSIAYNAALQLATAALAASGCRSYREAHHYRVIQSRGLTIGADQGLICQLDHHGVATRGANSIAMKLGEWS